jgi:DNA sulfur modification protein DndE
MSNKLKISKEASAQVELLSKRLNLRRNIVCRLAIGRSLAEKESVRSIRPKDGAGFEFHRYTLTGEYDNLYKALLRQHEGEKMDDKDYFSTYLRNHIERGIQLLYVEYQRVNSPLDFFSKLLESTS